MKTKNAKEINDVKKKILPLLKMHDVSRAGIFGSFARGEAKKTSDIDILVKFKGSKSLLDLIRLKLDLEEKLGRKADIVEYDVIHPRIREHVMKEQVKIL